jgi:hypothetical protein
VVACIIFIYIKIFVCLIKPACLLACNQFQIWGEGGVTIAFYGWASLNKKYPFDTLDYVLELSVFLQQRRQANGFEASF